MATSEANTSHGDRVQYYQRNLPSQPPGGGGGGGGGTGTMFSRASPLAESTIVTTTTTVISPAAAGGSGGGGSAPPASEGRAGKAVRRRSRASRKAPTTLLSADATNFRAMVQHFTGAHSGPFHGTGYLETAAAGGGGGGPTTLSFGLAQLHRQQPTAFSFGVQQQFPQYQQHHERPPFTLGGGGGRPAGDADVYLQGFGIGGGDPRRGNVEVSDGYLLESISSSSQMLQGPPASTGCRTSDGFLL